MKNFSPSSNNNKNGPQQMAFFFIIIRYKCSVSPQNVQAIKRIMNSVTYLLSHQHYTYNIVKMKIYISIYGKVHFLHLAHPFILAYMGTKFLIFKFNNISSFTTFRHTIKWEIFRFGLHWFYNWILCKRNFRNKMYFDRLWKLIIKYIHVPVQKLWQIRISGDLQMLI